MRRSSVLLSIVAIIVLTACGGGSGNGSPKSNPAMVTVSPQLTSLNLGQAVNIGAVVTDNKGAVLYNSTTSGASTAVTFSSSNTQAIQVANNGLVCAGAWDSLLNPVVCTPGTVGSATVTVASGAVHATTMFFAHAKIDSIAVGGFPSDLESCISKGGTQHLSALVKSGETDITATVGPITWNAAVADILTVDANNIASATNPGQTDVTAVVGDFRSSPATFVTCPVQSIEVHLQGVANTSATLDTVKTLQADLVDAKGKTIVISRPTSTSTNELTWNNSFGNVATITPAIISTSNLTATSVNTATVAAGSGGTTSIVVSCTPPRCNAGFEPVYSDVFSATTAAANSTTVFVTGPDFATGTGPTKIIPIATSTNTPGPPIPLAGTPNSFVMARTGTLGFLGTSAGLVILDAATNSIASTTPSITGAVLAVSSRGTRVVVSDFSKQIVFLVDTSAATAPTVTGTIQVFGSDAAYSPDDFRLFILGADVLGGDKVLTIVDFGSPPRVATSITDAIGLALHPSGRFVYVASDSPLTLSGIVSVFASCAPAAALDTIPIPLGASRMRFLPNGSQLLVASTNDPLEIARNELRPINVTPAMPSAMCPPVSPGATDTIGPSLGLAGLLEQIVVQSNSAKAFLIFNPTFTQNEFFVYDTVATSVTSVPLVNDGKFLGGADVTLDGTQFYVGTSGADVHAQNTAVHRVDLSNNTDVQQIPVDVIPSFVVVRPK